MKRIAMYVAGLAAIVLLLPMGSSTSARVGEQSRHTGHRGGKLVNVSGEFNGALKNEIDLSGRTIIVSKSTVLQGTRSGKLEWGYHVIREPMFVSGVADSRGRIRATMIVVAEGSRDVTSGEVGELPEDTAR